MTEPSRVVLSALLTNEVALIDEVSRLLTEAHFTDPNLRSLYRGVLSFRSVAGGVLTPTGVSNLISNADAGTAALITELYDSLRLTPASAVDARWAVSRLREDRERWLTQTALTDASEILSSKVVEESGKEWSGPADAREWVAARIAEIASEVSLDSSPAGDVRSEAREVMRAYAAAKHEDRSHRPRFGIPMLDEVSGGLGPGELVVIGAPSGLGKSHTCVHLAYEAVVRQGLSVYFATSETVRAVVRNRIIARHSRHERFADVRAEVGLPNGLDSALMERGALVGQQEEFLAMVVRDFAAASGSLWLAQSPHGQWVDMLASQVEARSRARTVDLVVVDYLALWSSSRRFSSRREELVTVITDAKHFAIDFNKGQGVPMVTPWQFNRASQEEMVRTNNLDINGLADTAEIVNSQPLHSLVLTPTGYRRMGDLAVGDPVIDPEGQPSKVTAIQPQGKRLTYRITFADGGVAESSLCHVWKVRGRRNSRMASEGWRLLRLGDFAPEVPRLDPHPAFPNRPRKSSHRRVIPTMLAPDFDDVGDRPLDPYLLAVLVGDGSLGGKTGKDAVRILSTDLELLDSVEALLPDGVCLSGHQERFIDHEKWSRSITVNLTSTSSRRPGCNAVNAALRQLGLWGCAVDRKFVPREYMMAPASVRVSVLQGLMDTDGTAGSKLGHGKANVFTSTSRQLRDDVVWLARSLGCKVSGVKTLQDVYYTRSDGTRVYTKDSYYCLIVPPCDISLYRLTRKMNAQRKYLTERPVRPIAKVELIGEHEHQCIRVSAESHLYVTNDFTVTHNTPDMVLALAPDGARRDRRFAPLKLGVLKNRDGQVRIDGDMIPIEVDYATSHIAQRMGADAISTNGHVDMSDPLAFLLGG